MKKLLCLSLLTTSVLLAGCGGSGTQVSQSKGAVFATQQNVDNAAEGLTLTGKQVVVKQTTPAGGVALGLNANEFTVTVDRAETSLKTGSNVSSAVGDGRATANISGLVSSIPLTTFSGDENYETRDPVNPSNQAEVVSDGSGNTVYIDIFTSSDGYRYVAGYYWDAVTKYSAGNADDFFVAHGVIGLETPSSNLPAGTVLYAGESFLMAQRSDTGEITQGIFATGFTVNFGDNTFTGENSQVSMAGTLSGGTISGSATAKTTGATGEVAIGDSGNLIGTIYGPNGEEIGGVFQIVGANGSLSGDFLGAQ